MGGAHSISHLIFGTDLLLVFTKANPKSIRTIQRIMATFEAFSGLHSIEKKGSIYFSRSVTKGQELASILRYLIIDSPMKHLGIPLTGRELQALVIAHH